MAEAASSGAAVFNGAPGTPRLVPDPGTDHQLPPAGSLNYGSISSLTALLSTNGVATSLVHGDHFEMMNGNEIRTITLDRDHTILGNQTSTVQQDRHDIVESNYNQHVTGTTQRVHIGATAEHFVDEHSNSHQSDRKMDEPETVFHKLNERVESANKVTQNYGYKTDICAAKTDITLGVGLEFVGAAIAHKITHVEGHSTVGFEYGALALEAREQKHSFKALKSEVHGLKGRLAEAELDIQELFVTPFALGIYV